MNSENIKADIELLRKITGDWQQNASTMERDIVLEILRRIYTEIKYGQSTAAATQNTEKIVPESDKQSEKTQYTESAAAMPKPDVQLQTVIQAATVRSEREVMPELDKQMETAPHTESVSAKHESDARLQTEAVPQSAIENCDEPHCEPKQNPNTEDLTGTETVQTVKRPLNRNVIRSLYGEPVKKEHAQEPSLHELPKEVEQEPGASKQETAAPELSQEAEQKQEIFAPEHEASVSELSKEVEQEPVAPKQETAAPIKVLGETINQGPTLGDTLQSSAGQDMASKIASADTDSIRGALGLNDRFLMIRDLFDGDAAAFDKTVSRLEEFTDLDNALLYINDTFDWDPESRGAKMIVELLVRKLS